MKAFMYLGCGQFEVTKKVKPDVFETTDAGRESLYEISTLQTRLSKHGSASRAILNIKFNKQHAVLY